MIWNLIFVLWMGSISPALRCCRSSMVHLSQLSCLGNWQGMAVRIRDESLSPADTVSLCPSPAKLRGQVLQRRSSARWKVLLVSVTLQVCSPEELFLSCFNSPASLLWQKGKTSTLTRRGTCRSSSPSAVCFSSDCWATWRSCWWHGSAPAALRQAEQTAHLCESCQMSHWGSAPQHPVLSERAHAFQQ